MGISRDNGYSSIIEGFLVVAGQRIRLAKTNAEKLVLAEECELSPNTTAELLIIVDDTSDSKRVELPDGVALGERCVRYTDVVPF